jgi:hypothetical protein
MDTLVDVFKQRIPSEVEMRKLSRMQQRFYGSHGVEEFATLTLFTCACQAIMEHEAYWSMIQDAVCYLKTRQCSLDVNLFPKRTNSCPRCCDINLLND